MKLRKRLEIRGFNSNRGFYVLCQEAIDKHGRFAPFWYTTCVSINYKGNYINDWAELGVGSIKELRKPKDLI